VFTVSSEPLIKPNVIPPAHCDEVAEPHMTHLVSNSPCISLELLGRAFIWTRQQNIFQESDAAPIFHGSYT
jgi:hypothetical protein